MPVEMQYKARHSWIAGFLATLPLLAAGFMGSAPPDAPQLTRTVSPRRPLQFARYCINHGRDPVLHTSTLTSRFRFRNIGNSTIELGEIERSCGCLKPELTDKKLEPGEIGEMKVTVPMVEQTAGFHEFQLTVHYSDDQRQDRHETILIKAVFPEPQIQVTPRAIDVSQRGNSNRPVTHHFSVADHRSEPLRIESVKSSVPWVNGSVESVKEDGEIIQIAVDIAGRIPEGTHRVLVQALTDDPQFPSVTMPMRISGPERSRPVRARPSVLRMHAMDQTPLLVSVDIPTSWQVSHVDCFPAELQCEWESPQKSDEASRRQVLELSLWLNAPPVSQVREGVITLHANNSAEMLTVRVEIVGSRRQVARNDALPVATSEASYSSN